MMIPIMLTVFVFMFVLLVGGLISEVWDEDCETKVRYFLLLLLSLFALVFCILKFSIGQMDSLPNIAFDGQDNLKKSYQEISDGFFNHDHYVHIIEKDKDINQIKDSDSIGGIKILKENKDNALVELKVIEHNENNEDYIVANKLAIMHEKDVKNYEHNIYVTYEDTNWSKSKHKGDEKTPQSEKEQDLKNIKDLIDSK